MSPLQPIRCKISSIGELITHVFARSDRCTCFQGDFSLAPYSFKLYACFLFKFSLAPRTFSFLLVDRRDYYASVCPFERFQTSLKKIWKTSEEFRGCSEDFRRCSEEFRECSEDFRSSHILTCCNLFSDRYAFTPIVDFGDEEDEDENMTLSDAFGESRKTLLYGCNPLHTNICMHILYTVLHSSPKVLERRLSLTINSFF